MRFGLIGLALMRRGSTRQVKMKEKRIVLCWREWSREEKDKNKSSV